MRMAVAHLNELWTKIRTLPYGRILGIIVIALLSAIVTLALFASKQINHLVENVRARQELRRHPPPPIMPSGDQLIDDQKLQETLAEHPEKSFELWVSRARALCQQKRWADSLFAYRQAELASSAKRGMNDQLVYAEDLFQLRRFDEAIELLTSLDLQLANAEKRAAVVSALARAHLAARNKDAPVADPGREEVKTEEAKPVVQPTNPPEPK